MFTAVLHGKERRREDFTIVELATRAVGILQVSELIRGEESIEKA